MSELITLKKVLIALANGQKVEIQPTGDTDWYDSTQWTVNELLCFKGRFRIKPQPITINGIEVPRNSKKHDKDDVVWVINTVCEEGYDWVYGSDCDSNTLYWTNEEDIKKVVSVLKGIFK